jgi:hypothetical protein
MELDNDNDFQELNFPVEKRNQLLIYIAAAAALNIGLKIVTMPANPTAFHLDGSIATPSEIKASVIKTMIIGIPILGFLLGTLVSLLPYRNLSYSKKYVGASLLSILLINLIFLAIFLINTISGL